MVTWTAHDISGTNNKNGTATYWGDIIFNGANPSGKMAFLNNLRGSYITGSFRTQNNKNGTSPLKPIK